MTPNQLAERFNVSPKAVRSFLNEKFPRPATKKHSRWLLTSEQIKAVEAKFGRPD